MSVANERCVEYLLDVLQSIWKLPFFTFSFKILVSFLLFFYVQIAGKRHKVINTFKSPLGQTRPPPPLKHIALMPLSQIRRVLDLQDTEGNRAKTCTPFRHALMKLDTYS